MSDLRPTTTRGVMRAIGIPLGVLCVLLLLLVGGVGFAIAHEYATTSCLNTVLQDRNGPTLGFARHLYDETKIKNPTPAQRKQLGADTDKAIRRWYFGLTDHPLGRC